MHCVCVHCSGEGQSCEVYPGLEGHSSCAADRSHRLNVNHRVYDSLQLTTRYPLADNMNY